MQEGNQQTTTVLTGTQTASVTSSAVSAGDFPSFVAYLNVTAAAGTTPTLDVSFQDSPDGTTWYDIPSAAFTQATAASRGRLVVTGVGPYLRAVATIGGTSPSFTFTVEVAGNY